MAVDLGDETFRPLLKADMMDVWGLLKVHDTPSELPGEGTDLPRGFLELRNVVPAVFRSFSRRLLLHEYRLVGQFAYPEEGTVLWTAKREKADVMLVVLTVGNSIYKDDWRYREVSVPFEDAKALDDPTERVYHVIVDFTLEWETGV